jgi:hypothetical protein
MNIYVASASLNISLIVSCIAVSSTPGCLGILGDFMLIYYFFLCCKCCILQCHLVFLDCLALVVLTIRQCSNCLLII